MDPPARPAPANDALLTPEGVSKAVTAAQAELELVAADPSLARDPLRSVLTAQVTLLRGMEAVFDGLRTTIKELMTAAERQRADVTAFGLQQRTELVADFAKQHEAALARTKAEELAHQAQVKAGLIDAAKDALKELLHLDRKHNYLRAFGYVVGPAIALLLVGTGFGWYLRGARNVSDVADNVAAIGTAAEQARQNAETLRAISDLLVHGMSPTDLAAVVSLHSVVATSIGRVDGDTVPAPCIAAVPPRVIMVAGKPVKACVIALRDNAVVQGGDFLINAIAARAQR